MSDLLRRLLHPREAVYEPALDEALATRDDDALAAALRSAKGWKRVIFAAALGDLRQAGPGDEALREAAAVTGPGTQDLRCASVLSLAKRLGPRATADLRLALSSKDAAVRDYAVMSLAAVGDASAWPEVLAWLGSRRSRSRSHDPPAASALHYLLRHLPEQDPGSLEALRTTVRRVWPVLEQDGVTTWLLSLWPGIADDGVPGVPDPDDWRRHPLFAADSR